MDIQIEQFLKHCKYEKNLSDKTIKLYRIDLVQFRNYNVSIGYINDIKIINKDIIRGYIESLNKLKPKSIKRKLASLKSFFNFCEFEDIISDSPFRKLKLKIKEPIQCPKTISKEQITLILKKVYQAYYKTMSNESLRNVIIIELLFSTGIRVSELANLRISDIDFEAQSIKVHGKGNKERIIYVASSEIISLMLTYLKKPNKFYISKIDKFYLKNKFGDRLSDQSIRSIVKANSKEIGEKGYVTPHIFRHSLATLLIESNVDVSFVQKLLGHSSITTTQIYTHISQRKQNEMLKNSHPRQYFNLDEIE